ncbi:MBL fold metallo-hydrolase [Ramlibacter sp.]|uniref:MBL fold metallo-hydrolase n=1 Tax=Ramlibacter sp. TaxID=1917967 RepID=UPI0017FB4750|nr:MBL fold metallo-hydrolase [Ramlibacter sp.]MBA2673092.1 MBL fold metallo-hydrolase [Ramlibacter sp.]
MRTAPKYQAPGLNRRRVGDFTVTCVSDGYLDISFELLSGIDAASAEDVLRAAGAPPLPRMNINTYVVQDATRTILIDSGAGGYNGWGGRLPVALAAAGVDPADVDTVLLTHAHPDHVGGLAGPGAAPRFPNVQALYLHEAELAFWQDDAIRGQSPDGFRPFFDIARNALAAYDGRLRPFRGEAVVPGITAVPLPGHTAGHTGYLIESDGEALLVWGDIVHFPDLQAARPEITIAFDSDAAQAAKVRRQLLDRACADRLLIGGMHLNTPNFVHVERAREGYALVKEIWSPALL